MQKSYAQTRIGTIAGCQQLPIASVTASGNDGNLPTNVLDNNLNTRWSNLGVGSFIQADLGVQKTICSVDIAWYRGNLRVNNFVISVSSDGTSFTNVFTGKSSGTSLSAETYSIPTSVAARFVRVTVNGNTENNWASITELSVDGSSNNNLPTADNKSINTNADTPVTITLSGTSPIPNDVNLKFSVLNMPQNGKLATGTTPNTVTYTPNPGFSGTDTFTYKATDGQGVYSNIATVTITVNAAQNNPPTADNKAISTNAGTPVKITLTGSDPIPGDTLNFSVVAIPQQGTLTNPTFNSVTYTPNTGFSGLDRFTYIATDGQGVNSTIATVSITVNAPPPPPPTANNINIQTNKETPIGITLTGTDPIPGDVLKFSVVGSPTHGTLAPGTVSSNVFYTPSSGFIGTDSFTYKATDGQGVDSNIAAVTVIVSNATSGILDQFGVREIYPTKAGGEQWFMNMNDPNHDSRTDPKTILTKNPDGSWKIASSAVRFQVFTSSGYHPELITTLNQQQMAAKGYMQSPNDWRDVEITGYVKLNKQGGDVRGASGSLLGGHYTWYARGGKHIGQGSPLGCEATSYHADWAYDGKTRFAKEQWHVSYVFTPYKPSTDSIAGKWVGFKTIMYNIQQNGNTAAKIEIWVDANNNGNWVKVNEFVDSGGFGKAGGECGGAPDQIITWGGPIATYRWDNSPDVDVKDLSVREIQALQ